MYANWNWWQGRTRRCENYSIIIIRILVYLGIRFVNPAHACLYDSTSVVPISLGESKKVRSMTCLCLTMNRETSCWVIHNSLRITQNVTAGNHDTHTTPGFVKIGSHKAVRRTCLQCVAVMHVLKLHNNTAASGWWSTAFHISRCLPGLANHVRICTTSPVETRTWD